MQYYTTNLVDGFYKTVKLLNNYVIFGNETPGLIPEAGVCSENEDLFELTNLWEPSLILPCYLELYGRNPAQSPLFIPKKGPLFDFKN